jgi:hypothetical protein
MTSARVTGTNVPVGRYSSKCLRRQYPETQLQDRYRKRATLRLRKRESTMLCMKVSALSLLAIAVFSVHVIVTPALSQTTPVSSAKSVRILGRLVLPEGRPVSFGVQLSRSDECRVRKREGAEGRTQH